MKTRTTLLILAALALFVAAPATAQNVDLEIVDVTVEFSEIPTSMEYRLTTHFRVINGSNFPVDHLIAMATFYGSFLVQEASSTAQYVQQEHTCPNSTWPNCGSGDCLNLYSFSADVIGECYDAGLLFYCRCKYEFSHTLEWVPYTGEPSVTIMLDPDEELPETNEDNNIMTISLEPVANESPSWSRVKALYR